MGTSEGQSGVLSLVMQPVEALLFQMLPWYDKYMYGPLSVKLSPYMARIPRYAEFGGQKYTVFTANILSCARAALVVFAAMFLKFQLSFLASLVVFFHDFLDHVDGMVAREQRKIYGQIDDPTLGGFMDAFCDKVFNCLCLWSLLMTVDTQEMSHLQFSIFLLATFSIFVYEFILGVVRVQDYFHSYYCRQFGNEKAAGEVKIAANMAGKLKEKLESFGLAFLCMASASSNLMSRPDGLLGVVMLLLSLRLAHSSLKHKLERRNAQQQQQGKTETATRSNGTTPGNHVACRSDSASSLSSSSDDDTEKFDLFFITQSNDVEVVEMEPGQKVDKIFTIGCFDLFHAGHQKLMRRMRRLGHQLIVGVHSDESIQTLKNRTPIDRTQTRMTNVRKFADQVFCVAGTDPADFVQCIVNVKPTEKALYVRGDDMVNFPARHIVEELMPVRFLPYTQGVSSTQLRKRLLANKAANGTSDTANGAPAPEAEKSSSDEQ